MNSYQLPQDMHNRIVELRDRGAMFYISHSGGKDSQAMTIVIERLVPAAQIVIIHADLPEVDWSGCYDHIKATCSHLQTVEVVAGKTFWQMVERRGMFPSPQYRQCTSDLKRDPINKWIRHDLKARGKSLAVSCIGIRAEESPQRSRAKDFKLNKRMSKAGREVYDMMPIHDMLIDQVWNTIETAGQVAHWAYDKGMSRLSCMFCIMASTHDLKTAARLVPDVYRRYVQAEKDLNFTLQNGRTLEEATGILADGTETGQPAKPPVQRGLFDRPCY